jgi:hypothetical protein
MSIPAVPVTPGHPGVRGAEKSSPGARVGRTFHLTLDAVHAKKAKALGKTAGSRPAQTDVPRAGPQELAAPSQRPAGATAVVAAALAHQGPLPVPAHADPATRTVPSQPARPPAKGLAVRSHANVPPSLPASQQGDAAMAAQGRALGLTEKAPAVRPPAASGPPVTPVLATRTPVPRRGPQALLSRPRAAVAEPKGPPVTVPAAATKPGNKPQGAVARGVGPAKQGRPPLSSTPGPTLAALMASRPVTHEAPSGTAPATPGSLGAPSAETAYPAQMGPGWRVQGFTQTANQVRFQVKPPDAPAVKVEVMLTAHNDATRVALTVPTVAWQHPLAQDSRLLQARLESQNLPNPQVTVQLGMGSQSGSRDGMGSDGFPARGSPFSLDAAGKAASGRMASAPAASGLDFRA